MGNFEIYSMGNPEFLIEVFKGLARLWSTDDIFVLFGIALILGLIASSFKWAIDQDKSPFPAKGFVISLVLVTGLLGPQSLVDVTVISKRDNSFQDVSNVPLLPAVSGWLITGTITVLADGFAQAFSIVGVKDVWSAFSPIQHFVGLASFDPRAACTPIAGSEKTYNICKTIDIYLKDCYSTSSMINDGKVQPISTVRSASPSSLIDSIKTDNKALQTLYFLSTNPALTEGQMNSCVAVHGMIKAATSSSDFESALSKTAQVQGVNFGEVDLFLRQQKSQGTISNAESSLHLANAMFMSSRFASYFPNSPYGQQVAKGMFDTVNQRQLANAQKKEYWMENAEIMQSFFEALAVFITPFIGITLAVSSQGLLAAGQYFMVWIFVNLWGVMIVLVNGFMALAMTNRFTEGVAASQNQFSLTAIDSQFATANSYISMGGMLYTFIPAICVFVMYKGVHAMQGLASKSMQDPSIKAERFAPDTGATVSNGQTSYGNQTSSYQNPTGDFNRGDNLVSTSSGDFSVGASTGSGASTGAAKINRMADGVSQDKKSAIEDMYSAGNGGSYDLSSGNQTQRTVSNKEQALAAAGQTISDVMNVSTSEGQRIAASGGLEVSAGGKLSMNFGDEGSTGVKVEVGAAVKGALGFDSNASQENKQSLANSLSNAKTFSTDINKALSKINTAGDVHQYGTDGSFKEAAKRGAGLAKQEQSLKEQSASLGNIQTTSGQLSQSTKLGMSQLSNVLSEQSTASFLKESNPELWENIQNKQFESNGQTVGGEQFLADRESEWLTQVSNTSANPKGESRAMALMDLVKQNDKIDLNKEGVDFEKEKNDNAMNQGIFNSLKDEGITGAKNASELYEQRGSQIRDMGIQDKELKDSFDEKDVLGTHTPISDIVSSNSKPVASADSIVTTAGARIDESNNAVSGKQERIEADYKDLQVSGLENDVPAVKSTVEDQVAAGNASLKNDSFVESLDAVGVAGNKLTEQFKDKNAGNNMNEYIISNSENGTSIPTTQANYDKGMELLTNLNSVNEKALDLGLKSEDKSDYQALLSLISDQGMVDSIVGADGNGTDSSRDQFSSNQIEALAKANQWYQEYSQSEQQSPTLSNAINNIDREPDQASATLSAYADRGIVGTTGSESTITPEVAHALENVLAGEPLSVIANDLGVERAQQHNELMGQGNINAEESKKAAHGQAVYEQLQSSSNALSGEFTNEQQTKIDTFLESFKIEFKTEDSSTSVENNESPSASTNVGGR